MEIDVASLPPEIAESSAEPIAWLGGECPVSPQTMVQVRCVFEREFDHTQPPRKASAWARRWNRDHDDECGITHYVIVAEPRDAGGVS
jgi:hypothetical protein